MFSAFDERLERKVAVKVFRGPEPADRRRFFAALALLLVAGGGDHSPSQVSTTTALPATTAIPATTSATTTATTAERVSCAELDAQRKALEEAKKGLGKLYKGDKEARKEKKREIDEQLDALDKQKQTCAK